MNVSEFPSNRSGKVIKTLRGYRAFYPNPLPPEIKYSPRLIRLLMEAERFLGQLAGVGRTLRNPYLLVGPAIHREAVLSSLIEGTEADLEDLFIFEAEPQERPEKSDVREVHNYVVALEYGLERLDTLPVSLRLVREIHERLMEGVRGGYATPGEFRTTQNWIGRPGCVLNEATYVPPPPEELGKCLGDWEAYLHSEDETPELIRLALMHYQFEAVHPFVDGNGRVGRLLIVLLMCYWRLLPQPLLYLSAFFERYRDDYYRSLLRVSQRGDWETWIEFFLTGIREQARDALTSARTLIDLQEQYRTLLHGHRISKITTSVLDHLFVNPVVTARTIHERCGGSINTAQNAIHDLEEVGVLTEVTRRRRNRMWVARELLDTLAERRAPVMDETLR
jgi:Fic family protein